MIYHQVRSRDTQKCFSSRQESSHEFRTLNDAIPSSDAPDPDPIIEEN